MKIRSSSHDLNAVLKDVTRATEAKAVVTWMTGVLIETDGDRIKAVCTNGTQTIIRYAECQTDVEGKVLLDAKLLLNVASKLPSCTCVLDATSGKKVVIKAEESKTNMALMDADAFVLPANVEKKFSFTCVASKLFNADGLGKPIIRIRDLKEQEFVTFTTEEHPKGHLIQPGDIVVGMDGEFRPYIWGNEPAWLNQRVCIFESNRPQGKAFVLYTIKPLLNKIEQTQVATTVIHIGKKDFDAFEIVLPDEATLDSFDSITAPMIEQIVNNRLQNKRLEILRDTLLPKLMSGELDVSNIEL